MCTIYLRNEAIQYPREEIKGEINGEIREEIKQKIKRKIEGELWNMILHNAPHVVRVDVL